MAEQELVSYYVQHSDPEADEGTTTDSASENTSEESNSDDEIPHSESIQEMHADEHDLIARLSLLSTLIFVAGAAFLVLKQRLDIAENSFVYGFALLATSVLPEFCIDYLSRRPFSHGRYSAVSRSQEVFGSDVVILNNCQSLVFLIATIVQGVAFFFYEELEDEYDEVTLYCDINLSAAVFWVLSGGMVLVMRGFAGCRCKNGVVGTIDYVANVIYTISTGVLAVSGMEQMEQFDYFDKEHLGSLLQGYAMDAWLVAGVLYLLSDIYRLQSGPQHLDLRPIVRRGRSKTKRSIRPDPSPTPELPAAPLEKRRRRMKWWPRRGSPRTVGSNDLLR